MQTELKILHYVTRLEAPRGVGTSTRPEDPLDPRARGRAEPSDS